MKPRISDAWNRWSAGIVVRDVRGDSAVYGPQLAALEDPEGRLVAIGVDGVRERVIELREAGADHMALFTLDAEPCTRRISGRWKRSHRLTRWARKSRIALAVSRRRRVDD